MEKGLPEYISKKIDRLNSLLEQEGVGRINLLNKKEKGLLCMEVYLRYL